MKSDSIKSAKAPHYIIVDNPNGPSKYWNYLKRWTAIRAGATIYKEWERNSPIQYPLPEGGVWLLVDEESQARFGSAKGMIQMSDDFDSELELVEASNSASTPSPEVPKTAELSHTPTPWEVAAGSNGSIFTVGDPYGHQQMHVADVRGWGHLTGVGACNLDPRDAVKIQDDNAAFIVHACNSYDASQRLIRELVEALKEFTAAMPAFSDAPVDPEDSWAVNPTAIRSISVGTIRRARAAIAKAEGK